MKLNKWMFGVLATALFAACSDKDLPDGGPAVEPGEGQGYIGINIQLPTDNSTRANDDFGDGEPSEQVVRDAVLLLFQGTDETNAKFVKACSLQEADPNIVNENGQISRYSRRVANVKGVNFSATDSLYALVMVNGITNGLIKSIKEPQPTWMVEGMTISDFQEKIFTLEEEHTGAIKAPKLYAQDTPGKGYASSIFMINSPLCTEDGGAEPPKNDITKSLPVLVRLNRTTYQTQSEAVNNPAGVIHVERIVGKVTCSAFNKETEVTVTINNHQYNLVVDKIWWDMAQDMADTYIVRNTNRHPIGDNSTFMWRWNYATNLPVAKDEYKYRMLGHNPVYTTKVPETNTDGTVKTDAEGNVVTKSVSYFRPYFCQVPGYNIPLTDKVGETIENKHFVTDSLLFNNETAVEWNGKGAFYPLENTFPVEHMVYANSTRIGFWVTYTFQPIDGGDPIDPKKVNFYIHGVDKSTLYFDDEDGYDPLTNLAIAYLSNRSSDHEMWKAVDAALNKDEEGSIENVNIGDLIKFTYEDTNDGSIVIKSVNFKTLSEINEVKNNKYKGFFKAQPAYKFDENDIAALNNLGNYYKYDGGKVFYEVRIKHFGDDQTPWEKENQNTTATTITESYGPGTTEAEKEIRKQNYLGRYGIVRNNWYDLQVKSIKRLGDPTDPARWDNSWPETPNDNKDRYIAVEMRVLSWAKRSQEVNF